MWEIPGEDEYWEALREWLESRPPENEDEIEEEYGFEDEETEEEEEDEDDDL